MGRVPRPRAALPAFPFGTGPAKEHRTVFKWNDELIKQ
jgi:hypothetical protein